MSAADQVMAGPAPWWLLGIAVAVIAVHIARRHDDELEQARERLDEDRAGYGKAILAAKRQDTSDEVRRAIAQERAARDATRPDVPRLSVVPSDNVVQVDFDQPDHPLSAA